MAINLQIYHSDGSTGKVCSSESDKWRTSYLFNIALLFSPSSLSHTDLMKHRSMYAWGVMGPALLTTEIILGKFI